MAASLLASFLVWHYRDGLPTAFANARRAALGFWDYFSVLHLLQTLLVPWHRVRDPYGRGFEPSRFFYTLAGNLISRILGAIVRSAVIIIGLGASAAAAAVGVVFLVFWIAAPLLVPLLFWWGLAMVL